MALEFLAVPAAVAEGLDPRGRVDWFVGPEAEYSTHQSG